MSNTNILICKEISSWKTIIPYKYACTHTRGHAQSIKITYVIKFAINPQCGMARAESLRYLTKIFLKGYSGAPNSIFKNKALLNLINGFSVIPPPSRPPATLIKSFWATLKVVMYYF